MTDTWFVQPETKRLDLSDGQWILVKQRLALGERRQARARAHVLMDGELKFNRVLYPLALVTAYLLDWSLTDAAGKPVVIRNLSADQLTSVLDSLDPDRFDEIETAIDAHLSAMEAERTQEKKLPPGATSAATTSSSPSAAAGIRPGSVN